MVKVDVEWPLPECNLNLPKNIKKKYIFILNRVLKPLYMWTFDISLFLYEKKGQIIQLLLNFSLWYFPEIKSKYRSENSIYRILNSFMHMSKNRPQRHFQTKYTYNQCQRRKYRCLDRHIQLNKKVVENKIGVKWSFRVCYSICA